MRYYFFLVWPAHSACLLPLSLQKWTVLGQGNPSSLLVVPLLCPVTAMQQYFLLAKPRSGPLFYFRLGHYLTWCSVTHLLWDSARSVGLPHESLKGHSFRIGAASRGAASAATAVGLPDWLIKVLGRWSSDCYQIYIRMPESVLLSAIPKMASISGSFL